MKFTPVYIFSTLRMFYVKMATSEGGGGGGRGVCIFLVGAEPNLNVAIVKHGNYFSSVTPNNVDYTM